MKLYNKSSFLAIKLFILIWCASMGLLANLPIASRFGNMLDVYLLNIFFMSFILIGSFIAFLILGHSSYLLLQRTSKPLNRNKFNFICTTSILLSILGFLLVWYDRVSVRGIDYSQGVRAARYQWLMGDVAGSMWGKVGNLLVPFSYCILFMGIFYWEQCSKLKKWLTIIVGLGVQIGFATLNGGRSNILMALVFTFVVCLIRKMRKKTFFPPINRIQLIFGGAIIYVLFLYVVSIFYSFSSNNINYVKRASYMLGAVIDADYIGNNLMNTIILISLYLLHGIYYSGAVILWLPASISLDQFISLRIPLYVLYRLGITNSFFITLPQFDGGGGNFISLPGILLYDYGYIGFIVLSLCLGLLFGIAIKMLCNMKNLTNIKLIFCIFIFIVVYMSPITIGYGIGYFIFMIFALLVMEILASFFYGPSGWI